MKKLNKLSLDKLTNSMTTISEMQQRAYVGGDGGSYTFDQATALMNAGQWQGGYIDGVYTAPMTIVQASPSGTGGYEYIGDRYGSSTVNNIIQYFAESNPVFGQLLYTQNYINDYLHLELASRGYSDSTEMYFNAAPMDYDGNVRYRIYDSSTGQKVIDLSFKLL